MLLRIHADLRELKAENRSEHELHQIHELLKRAEEREAHVRDLLKKGWSRVSGDRCFVIQAGPFLSPFAQA